MSAGFRYRNKVAVFQIKAEVLDHWGREKDLCLDKLCIDCLQPGDKTMTQQENNPWPKLHCGVIVNVREWIKAGLVSFRTIELTGE